jgi:YggT family protein
VSIICFLLNLYLLAVFARIILSWFPMAADGAFGSIYRFLLNITEPVLGPIRSALPPVRLGGFALDLSPIIVIIGLQVLLAFIC